MVDDRPSFFADVKVFFSRVGTHWREFRMSDFAVVLFIAGLGFLAVYLPWWVSVSAFAFSVVVGVLAFRLWKVEHAALLKTVEELLDAEERLALRARLDVMYGLLEEGWRLEPLVLHLPTKSGWTAERLRGVIERVGRPVLDWQFRVRNELEVSGLGAVSQWDAASDGLAGEQAGGFLEETEEAALLREVVQIRTGYFRRVPLLRSMVTSARG